MGLIAVGMGPSDQQTLRTLEPEVVRTLRKTAIHIQKGQGKTESLLWFGDDSDVWMKTLSHNLDKMASITNCKPIEVVGTNWKARSKNTSAAAKQPTGGWAKYTKMSGAQNRNFRIRLDIAWNAKPLYRPSNTPGLSKFHTIVHELTHLVLNTDDVSPAYGEINCKNKATNNPNNAKRNADNWAFFVDDFR